MYINPRKRAEMATFRKKMSIFQMLAEDIPAKVFMPVFYPPNIC